MINKKSKKRKVSVKIFHSFKEQEEADIKYYRKMSPEQKLEELEEIRNFYIKMKYGHVPAFRRIYKVVKRK